MQHSKYLLSRSTNINHIHFISSNRYKKAMETIDSKQVSIVSMTK
ncbi:hypothetical protein NYE25_04230 [Paenibacillus sp. FSL E2-8871]